MTQPNPSTAMARAVLDELSRGGVRLIAISPGSRSGALAIAAASHEDIETRVFLDERSAGFYALGHSKAAGRPAAVICTSGTAVANYMPSVVEASMSLTPLIVISADRPQELHGVGANQTVEQSGLFSRFVRLGVSLEAPGVNIDGNDSWRASTSKAVDAAIGAQGPAGPVHMNLEFREPTVPAADDGRSVSPPYPFPIDGREGGGRWTRTDRATIGIVETGIPETERGLVIAGDGRYDAHGLAETAARLGWPILATAASGLRGSGVVRAYEWLLAEGVPDSLRPEVVYVVGGIGPSRRLEQLAAGATRAQVRIDAGGRNLNPSLNATAVVVGDPVATLRSQAAGSSNGEWSRAWEHAQDRVLQGVARVLKGEPMSGPAVADTLNRLDWDLLAAASSLPVRDVDSTLAHDGRIVANRGASGIDGFISTALGAATTSRRSLALVGDLSLLHDSNGLLAAHGHNVVFVVVNNGGGGLFDLLPQAVHAPRFDELFIASQERDLAGLAAFHGIQHTEAHNLEALESEAAARLEAGGVHLVEVRIDRDADVAVRGELDRIGAAALRSKQA